MSTVKVSGGPAGTLQFKPGGRKFLDKSIFTTFRTLREGFVAHLLQIVVFEATVGAFISVNRHDKNGSEKPVIQKRKTLAGRGGVCRALCTEHRAEAIRSSLLSDHIEIRRGKFSRIPDGNRGIAGEFEKRTPPGGEMLKDLLPGVRSRQCWPVRFAVRQSSSALRVYLLASSACLAAGAG